MIAISIARAAVLGVFLEAGSAGAQTYPRLHVSALSQRADRTAVEPGGVFHLTIHVRLTQRRDRIDELILGTFTNCEIISNETIRTALPAGTDFVERLAVQTLGPGVATISPAYIDAIDPALGKPMRFSSNAVRVSVNGGPASAGVLDDLADKARRLGLAILIVLGLGAAAFVVFVLFVRRRRRAPAATAAPMLSVAEAPPPPATAPVLGLGAAANVYARERSQAALLNVRGILFQTAGVPAGATLVDALHALGAREPDVRTALLAAEVAAFGPAAERVAAGEAMLVALQAYCGGQAATGAWTS